MPFFRYSAQNSGGSTVDGTVEAATPEEAMQQLLKQGLTIQQIMKTVGPAPSPTPAGTPPPPRKLGTSPMNVGGVQNPTPSHQNAPPPPRKLGTSPINVGGVQSPAPSQQSAPPPPRKLGTSPMHVGGVQPAVIHTKRVNDGARMFFFTQLAQHLKAGIGPAQSLSDLAPRVAYPMRPALEDASKSTAQGGTISDAFERYPDLFPEHVVGTIRAAETGGFLPDALTLLSDQAQNAHAFARWFWWVRPVVVNGFIMIPLAWLATRTILKAWTAIEAQGEGATPEKGLAALLQQAGKLLLWPVGPLTLTIWLATYIAYRILSSPKARKFRHEVMLRWPVFGPRTRHECLSVFTWIMSRVTKAGISPNRSWELASHSVPNLAVRERLDRIGRSLSGSEKLSDAVFKENFFPQEYAPMLATAEFTGDFPGAFEYLAKVSQVEFEAAQTSARMKSSRWGFLGYIITAGVVLILLVYMFYRELLPLVVGGLDFVANALA